MAMGLFNLFGNKKKKIQDFRDRGALILDVRTKSEYQQGAITGSKHIPLQQIAVRISEIKQWNKPVITCCVSGARSGAATKILRKHGIDSMNGGGWNSLQKKI